MRFLLDQPFGAWDLETTSVDVEDARIVTACTALMQPAEPLWQQRIESHLAAVEVDIPAEATAIHGITTDFAKQYGERPDYVIKEVVFRLAEMMLARFPIVGMNLAYDFTVLDRECRRHDVPTLTEVLGADLEGVVDIYVLDKWLDPYRPGGRKLTDLIQFYGVRHDGAHDSTSDALAAARVAYRMAQVSQQAHDAVTQFFRSQGRRQPQEIADRFDLLGALGLATLHERQAVWRYQQQESLREYLIKKGERNPDCDPHWPVRPYTGEVSHGT